MVQAVTSSINICPINFNIFSSFNNKIDNIEATILFLKLKFYQKKSKIIKNGKIYIARTREQLGQWFNFGIKKIDRLLSLLEEKKLIEKNPGLWYGNKKLFISVGNDNQDIPVHLHMFDSLLNQSGSLKAALIFSKIAFAFAKTKIMHEGLLWCCLKKEDLATWAQISVRTLDLILTNLAKKGLFIKKKFVWKEKLQTHFHIPSFVITTLLENITQKIPLDNSSKRNNKPFKRKVTGVITSDTYYNPPVTTKQSVTILPSTVCTSASLPQEEILPSTYSCETSGGSGATPSATTLNGSVAKETHNDEIINYTTKGQNYREQPVTLTFSIKTRSKEKKLNNNTGENLSTGDKNNNKRDIIFNTINEQLTKRQITYLESALKNTINRFKICVSSPASLFEELKFAILNKKQRKGVVFFKHAVSRIMKIIADGNWRTPHGFYTHSIVGQEIRQRQVEQTKIWEKQKQEERIAAKIRFSELTGSNTKNTDKSCLTEKALKIAEVFIRIANENKESSDYKVSRILDNLTKEITSLIIQGAEKTKILLFMNKNINFLQ